jgi:hypothetical protein
MFNAHYLSARGLGKRWRGGRIDACARGATDKTIMRWNGRSAVVGRKLKVERSRTGRLTLVRCEWTRVTAAIVIGESKSRHTASSVRRSRRRCFVPSPASDASAEKKKEIDVSSQRVETRAFSVVHYGVI